MRQSLLMKLQLFHHASSHRRGCDRTKEASATTPSLHDRFCRRDCHRTAPRLQAIVSEDSSRDFGVIPKELGSVVNNPISITIESDERHG
jgi:hypothetical protein